MNDILGKLQNIDWSQVPLFLSNTLKNPTENPQAFALLVAAATVVLALIILLVALIFMSMPADEEEFVEVAPAPVAPAVAAAAAQAGAEGVASEEEAKRVKFDPVFTLIIVVLLAVIWLVGGMVTRRNDVCLSCHLAENVHMARSDSTTATVDPHDTVECVECHESPKLAITTTTKVPARVWHYVGAYVKPSLTEDYGKPVTNTSCAACHQKVLETTYENKTRGLKVSHKEPLEADARCIDCHRMDKETGVVDRFTVGMDPCLRCHDAKAASADCEFCHTKDVGYAARSRGTFRAKYHDAALNCGACHKDQSKCDNCHGLRMPHTTAFMGPAHARTAVEDIWYNNGKVCKRCHTDTRRPCSKCHQGTPFPGHAPSYMIGGHKSADPYNNGCDGCHGYRRWINGRNFCANCHPEYLGGKNRGTRPPNSSGPGPEINKKGATIPDYMKPAGE